MLLVPFELVCPLATGHWPLLQHHLSHFSFASKPKKATDVESGDGAHETASAQDRAALEDDRPPASDPPKRVSFKKRGRAPRRPATPSPMHTPLGQRRPEHLQRRISQSHITEEEDEEEEEEDAGIQVRNKIDIEM